MHKKLIEYRVTGFGPIPLDMLRYDQSWPATTADTETMNELISGDIPFGHKVELLFHGLRCTSERWKSFGWQVLVERKL